VGSKILGSGILDNDGTEPNCNVVGIGDVLTNLLSRPDQLALLERRQARMILGSESIEDSDLLSVCFVDGYGLFMSKETENNSQRCEGNWGDEVRSGTEMRKVDVVEAAAFIYRTSHGRWTPASTTSLIELLLVLLQQHPRYSSALNAD
jgi:hypothetical protein